MPNVPDQVIVPPPPGTAHYPSSWTKWEDAKAKGYAPFAFGFTTYADVNRFGARFRMARAFDGLSLGDYGSETVAGYSSLFRVFLCWTTFEQYLRALGQQHDEASAWYAALLPDGLVGECRADDSANKFFQFIRQHTKRKAKTMLAKHLAGESICPTYLAAGIRHVFAHGILTPNANGADPAAVARICDRLAAALLAAMDGNFTSRVDATVPPSRPDVFKSL